MMLVIAAVYDSKVGAYSHPQAFINQAVAQRAFADAVRGGDNNIALHATDFSMFILGSFNDETGEIRMFPQHINLGLAASYLKESQHVQPEISESAVSDATRILKGAPRGNSQKHVRPEPRPQDDV